MIIWYYNRIRRIPLYEYPYRLKIFIRKNIDRWLAKPVRLKCDHSIDIRSKISMGNFHALFPSLVDPAIDYAERALKHNFDIFDIDATFGAKINWHLDPQTKKTWPYKYWGDIKFRNTDKVGGIKFACEINRMYQLPRLAMAYAISGKIEYKTEIFNQLLSWKTENTYPKGINWISGIELGIRIINLIYTLKIIPDDITDENRTLVINLIEEHARHLIKYPSKHSSCANHAIAEALGLFASGLCLPSIKGALKWKESGRKILDKQVSRQIFKDGGGFEHSIPYLIFVLDHYIVYYLLCIEYEETVEDAVTERLQAAFNFLYHISDSNGNFPMIGDDDGGFLIKLWFGNQNNLLSLLNTGAIIFNKSEWLKPGAEFDQKTYMLLGKDAESKWEKLKAKSSQPAKSRYFKNSGLCVLRHHDKVDFVLVGNSGPLGLKPLGGHGHADALSFWLSINGTPYFVDPGTYLYGSGGNWRDYFRSTSAHNTLKVDSKNQAASVGTFIFDGFYNIIDPYCKEECSELTWSAGHDAYSCMDDPVFHFREITIFKKAMAINIKDKVKCNSCHKIEAFYHIHPDVDVINKDGSLVLINQSCKLLLKFDRKWESQEIFNADKKNLLGWYSKTFNKLEAATTIKLTANISQQTEFKNTILLAH